MITSSSLGNRYKFNHNGYQEGKLNVVVLQPSYSHSSSTIKELDTAREITQWADPSWNVRHIAVDKAHAVQNIRDNRADVYVNLCDGAWDEDSAGIEVVYALERFQVPFTGAGSKFYDPTKEDMKKFCYYWNIGTPRGLFAFNDSDVDRAAQDLRFPMFVKHFHGYNSVGITNHSKVHTIEQLREQSRTMIDQYGGALIEEFVEGREFSVLVCSNPDNEKEPLSFLPVECIFEEAINFKTFDYKWKSSRNPWKPVTDTALSAKLQAMTRELFVAMGGEGYARSDIRMDAEGNLYLLEINPNCSLFYADDNGATADVILMLDGFGKKNFLKKIIEYALYRSRKSERAYMVHLEQQRGGHMRAARDIAAGETIYKLEEAPHRLVTRTHVMRNWSAQFQQFFKDFCYPVTEDLWVMWDVEPDQWKPINHSCDPNAWVEGLNLVARRSISGGEEITMDYATMYADIEGPAFSCLCRSPNCRGGWKPDDYAQTWFKERYAEHITDFVRQKRKQRELIARLTSASATATA